ncbi:MAG: DUF2807 domain-containing protein [Pseudomonadota bacterium]
MTGHIVTAHGYAMRILFSRSLYCMAIAWAMLLSVTSSPAHAAERSFSTGNFTAIRIVGDMDIRIVSGPRKQVVATGSHVVLSRFSVRTSGRVLTVIMRQARTASDEEPPLLQITAPEVTAISYQGNGFVDIEQLVGRNVRLSLIGAASGRVRMVAARSLLTSMTSSGSLVLEGAADRHDIAIGGYGNVDAVGMQAENVNIVAEGTVELVIHARDSATGLASEGAKVTIVGGADCDAILIAGSELVDTEVLCGEDAIAEDEP